MTTLQIWFSECPPLLSYCRNSSTLSLLRNIQRPIVEQIGFTATCTGIPYIYIYIYIYIWIQKTDMRKVRFTWVKLMDPPPPSIKLAWQLYRSDFQIFRSTCSHCWLPPLVSNLTTLQIWFSDTSDLPAHTSNWSPLNMSLSVPVHCLCKVISKDLLWTSRNRYVYTSKDILGRKSILLYCYM